MAAIEPSETYATAQVVTISWRETRELERDGERDHMQRLFFWIQRVGERDRDSTHMCLHEDKRDSTLKSLEFTLNIL